MHIWMHIQIYTHLPFSLKESISTREIFTVMKHRLGEEDVTSGTASLLTYKHLVQIRFYPRKYK